MTGLAVGQHLGQAAVRHNRRQLGLLSANRRHTIALRTAGPASASGGGANEAFLCRAFLSTWCSATSPEPCCRSVLVAAVKPPCKSPNQRVFRIIVGEQKAENRRQRRRRRRRRMQSAPGTTQRKAERTAPLPCVFPLPLGPRQRQHSRRWSGSGSRAQCRAAQASSASAYSRSRGSAQRFCTEVLHRGFAQRLSGCCKAVAHLQHPEPGGRGVRAGGGLGRLDEELAAAAAGLLAGAALQ